MSASLIRFTSAYAICVYTSRKTKVTTPSSHMYSFPPSKNIAKTSPADEVYHINHLYLRKGFLKKSAQMIASSPSNRGS